MRGLPKDVREHIRFAVDAINAHQRGMSVPRVALNYRYEPGQAETFLRNVILEYGAKAVRQHCPANIFSLVSPIERER
jgi:hypothetical protein